MAYCVEQGLVYVRTTKQLYEIMNNSYQITVIL